jgi:hypothetical protein
MEVKRSTRRILGSIALKFSRTAAVVVVSGAVLVSYLLIPAWTNAQISVSAPKYTVYSGLNDLIANQHAPGEFMILNSSGGENIIVRSGAGVAFISLGNSDIHNNERQVLTDLGLTPAVASESADFTKINGDIAAYLSANNFGLTYRSLSWLVDIGFGLIFLLIGGLVLWFMCALYSSLSSRWGDRETTRSLFDGRSLNWHPKTYWVTDLIYGAMTLGFLAIVLAGIYNVSQIKTATAGMTSVSSVKDLISDAQTKPLEYAIEPASASGSAPTEQYNILALASDGTIYHLDNVLNGNTKSGDYTYASLDQVTNDLAPVANLVPASGADLAALQAANTEIVAHSNIWGGAAWNLAAATFGYLVLILFAGMALLMLMQDLALPGPTWGVKPKKVKKAEILENPKTATSATKKMATAAEELLNRISGKVPDEVYERVKLICDLALNGLEAKNGENTIGDKDAFGLSQIITSYLPEGLDAYLSVPKRFTAKGLRGHRPPLDILMEQLTLIEGNCRYLTETAVLDRTARLEAQEQFLRDKDPSSPLKLG